MKKTMIVLLILTIALAGCKAEESKDCDYTTITQQNTDLITQFNTCIIDKEKINSDYTNLKTDNNQLKIDYLNCQVNKTYYNEDTSVSCASFIRQISRIDTRLEECYQMNVTFNCTEAERDLDLCEEKIENITNIID